MATRSTVAPSFAAMAAYLDQGIAAKEVAPVFVTNNPSAAIKHSEPMVIVAVQYNEVSKEIRAVGADGNVRICKIDRLQSIEHARVLWKVLTGAKKEGTTITFMAAGGFSPDRWFFDICHA